MFGFFHEFLEKSEPRLPEGRMFDVDARHRGDLRRRFRAAQREHLKKFGDKRFFVLPVFLVKAEHEKLGERVGVAVKRAVDEMGDVFPAVPVIVGERDAVAVHLGVGLNPEIA